jgi:hypothetical protein
MLSCWVPIILGSQVTMPYGYLIYVTGLELFEVAKVLKVVCYCSKTSSCLTDPVPPVPP